MLPLDQRHAGFAEVLPPVRIQAKPGIWLFVGFVRNSGCSKRTMLFSASFSIVVYLVIPLVTFR
jgi:hypothetical protein